MIHSELVHVSDQILLPQKFHDDNTNSSRLIMQIIKQTDISSFKRTYLFTFVCVMRSQRLVTIDSWRYIHFLYVSLRTYICSTA